MSSSSNVFERENHVQTYPSQGHERVFVTFPSFQACSSNEPREWQPSHEEKRPHAFPSAAVEILRRCRSRAGAEDDGLKRDEAKGQRQRAPPPTLSVTQLIKMAMRSFTHTDSKTGKDFHHSAVIHPYRAAFSRSKSEDIRLVQDLLSCAWAVSNHSNNCASEFLEEFSKLSSGSTNVTQRLVYYFAESLRDRILPVNTRPSELIPPISETADLIEKLPFNQVMQFAGVQAVLDHVSSCARVHVVDLGLYGGLRHAVLMQALATRSGCPMQHLKITAVAAQLNLLVEEESVLRPDPEETVVVQAAHILRFMIPKLENLMLAVRSLNPHVMIIIEVEANVDSKLSIRHVVAAEEEERKFRIIGINFWRGVFGSLDGNSLIVGWKDTPPFSLSAWKFHKIGSM
ncbi:DELLA protein RGL1-like [Salvia divinorum]|uniref:DELLA protein RGL1-like n=1 Tax=Salvia divinorum TaxID=28513 RepID=A0ABD1GMG3_SALDI